MQTQRPTVMGRARSRVKLFFYALIFVFATAMNCAAQSTNCVSIQVLNANNAKPLRNVAVRVFTFVKPGNYPMLFHGKTDTAGSIRFCLGDSIPARLIYTFGKHFYTCSASEVETAELLEHGLVDRRDQCGYGKLKYNRQPKPAELVVFAQPWSLEEKIFGQFP
jgi:hypothetical protein